MQLRAVYRALSTAKPYLVPEIPKLEMAGGWRALRGNAVCAYPVLILFPRHFAFATIGDRS